MDTKTNIKVLKLGSEITPRPPRPKIIIAITPVPIPLEFPATILLGIRMQQMFTIDWALE